MRERLNAERYHFLDRVGVGQESIWCMTSGEIEYLCKCINQAISIIRFEDVDGMEDYSGKKSRRKKT